MLNIHELYIFLIAAQTENFSEAARVLKLTQPAVSMQIQALEKQLGTELFKRSGRRIVLSEAGEVLKPLAGELISMSSRIEEMMTTIKGEVLGILNIGCSADAAIYIMPPILAEYQKAFPKVQVKLDIVSTKDTLQKLLSGENHLAVFSKEIKADDLECMAIYSDDIVLVVPTDHPWAQKQFVKPEDFPSARFVTSRDKDEDSSEYLKKILLPSGLTVEDLNIALMASQTADMELAVEAGIGVAFISRLAAERGVRMGRVKIVPLQGEKISRRFCLARNMRMLTTRAQLEFWQLVEAEVKKNE